jgi:hypothetical protein
MEPMTPYEHALVYYENFSPDGWFIEYRFDDLAAARKIVSDIEDLNYGYRAAAKESLAMIGTVQQADRCWAMLMAGRIADKDILDIHERATRGGGRFQRLLRPPSSALRATEWGPAA